MISTEGTSANVIQGAAPPQDQIERGTAWREPRTLALAWLAAYLVGTGVILVIGGHWRLAALHGAVIALAGLGISRSMTLGDLLPLIAAPLLYSEIPVLIAAVGTNRHDPLVQSWELALFGAQPARTLAGHLPSLALSEVLHAGYLAYYLVIFAPPLLLLAKGRRRAFGETVFALTVTCTVCWAIFVALPTEGPRYLWGAPPGVPDGPFRRLAVSILAAGSSRGTAFPSSHMAVSVAQTVLAWRWQRPVGWAVAAVTLLIGFGAVYGGFHYGVDMIAGAGLGALISWSIVALFNTGTHTS